MVEIGQVVSEKLFNNIMILYMYTAQGQGKLTLKEQNFDCKAKKKVIRFSNTFFKK